MERRNRSYRSYGNLNDSRRVHKDSYVDGNTVRKFQVVPQQEEIDVEKHNNRVAIRQNRERVGHMNPAYVVFLTVASIVSFFICFQYIQLRSQITSDMKTIATLESDLSALKISNDAELSRVNNSIDLEEIKRIAMEELGMVYASEDQVVLYQDKDAEYFRQYEDVK